MHGASRRASVSLFQRQLDCEFCTFVQTTGTDLSLRLLRQCHEEARAKTTASTELKVRRQPNAFVSDSYPSRSGIPSKTDPNLARFIILVGVLCGIRHQLRNE